MSSSKCRGFTIIEVLAVIIILAIIALITTPIVLKVIDNTRKKAFRNSSLGAIKAAEMYEAKNEFIKIDETGIDITKLEMDNNNFTSRKIIRNVKNGIELVNVTVGVYCAKGTKTNLLVIKGSCDRLDTTPPTNIKITTNLVTTNKIIIVVQAYDLESGIKQYHYSLDGINYKSSKTSIIELEELENNTTYKVYVKVENNNGIISEVVEKEITTEDIEPPTYIMDKTGWTTQKIVTITYPERKEGYI